LWRNTGYWFNQVCGQLETLVTGLTRFVEGKENTGYWFNQVCRRKRKHWLPVNQVWRKTGKLVSGKPSLKKHW